MKNDIFNNIVPLPPISGEDKIRMHNDSHYAPFIGRLLIKILAKLLKQLADSWKPDDWPPECSTSPLMTEGEAVEDEDGYEIELHFVVKPLKASPISKYAKIIDLCLDKQFVILAGIRQKISTTKTRMFNITLDQQTIIPDNPQDNFSVKYKGETIKFWDLIIKLYQEKYQSRPTIENCISYLKLKFVGGVLPQRNLSQKFHID